MKNGELKNIFHGNEHGAITKVDDLLEVAIKQRASDIHIDPVGVKARVRFRIDGCLQDVGSISGGIYSAWLSRLKIITNMDIGERRLPQDGSIEMQSLSVDLRIATLPTILGEKITIRILRKDKTLLSIDGLGFSEDNKELYKKLYNAPNGMVLFTGPTGSGKTTSLYATLNNLNRKNFNIITIEDPVEYNLFGANQVAVNNKSGLTFARGLRAIVRQDPDVIMIGEIRDSETASIAIQAALTGHLVFSTLHTNTAIGAVSRLLNMDIPRYLLSAALRGVVGQRLVRKVCPYCAASYIATAMDKRLLGLDMDEDLPLLAGTGCKYCNGTGYYGRIALHEVFDVNNEVVQAIADGKSEIDLLKQITASGFKNLRADGISKVLGGQTTLSELLREGII